MSPRQPRRHHTVPRLYLRAFADRNRLLMRARGGATDELRNIKSVAFSRDFYAFTVGGVRDAIVEDWLQRTVEDPAAGVIRRVLDAGWPPTAEDRAVISTFVAFQILRTPLIRDYMAQIDRVAIPMLWAGKVLAKVREENGLTEDEAQQVLAVAQARALSTLNGRTDSRSFLRTMVREADRQVPRLLARSWTILRAAKPLLITSDNPVAKFFPLGPPAGFTGVAPRDAELHLPLCPSTLLILEREGADGQLRAPIFTEELAVATNSAQALGAHRVVLRHPSTPWPATLTLGPHAPRLPEPTITTRTDTAREPIEPVTYPPIHDPRTANLLQELETKDTGNYG